MEQGKTEPTDSFSASGQVLGFENTYPCPACGSGHLGAIALMDVFACSFCQHLFTANLQAQSVQLADSLQPMAWYWNGISWRTAHHRDTSAALIWLFASTLTVIPVVIIALANYIFPPLESYGSSSAASVQDNLNFPVIWTGLTLISHGAMSLWLLAEYHRWPWYIASGIRLQRMGARWFGREPVGGN